MSNTTIAPFLPEHRAAVLAALELGNQRIQSPEVAALIAVLGEPLARDDEHYLFVRVAGDQRTFFGCGAALGAKEAMVADGRRCFLLLQPRDTCPNCREE